MSNRFNDVQREPANMAEKGSRKYREKIHADDKKAENLPYKFSKPAKNKLKNIYIKCTACNKDIFVTEDTILVVCLCGKVTRVKESKRKDL